MIRLLPILVLLALPACIDGYGFDDADLITNYNDTNEDGEPDTYDDAVADQLAEEHRAELNALLSEYGELTLTLTLDDDSQDAWDENAEDLADLVLEAYGEDVAGRFLDLWRLQRPLYLAYAQSLATGDTLAADSAADGLAQVHDQLVDLIAGVSEADARLLNERLALVLEELALEP